MNAKYENTSSAGLFKAAVDFFSRILDACPLFKTTATLSAILDIVKTQDNLLIRLSIFVVFPDLFCKGENHE